MTGQIKSGIRYVSYRGDRLIRPLSILSTTGKCPFSRSSSPPGAPSVLGAYHVQPPILDPGPYRLLSQGEEPPDTQKSFVGLRMSVGVNIRASNRQPMTGPASVLVSFHYDGNELLTFPPPFLPTLAPPVASDWLIGLPHLPPLH